MTTSAVQLEVAGKQTLLFPDDATADRRHIGAICLEGQTRKAMVEY